jgi:pyruvate/2-oxoglutarate dehydrogenase complex dihydrolipoamide acyltransferase (E2) component
MDEFDAKPFLPYRDLLHDGLKGSRTKHDIHFLTTCDVTAFKAYEAQCKAQRRRPPSLVAYFARCAAVVVAKNPERIAGVYRRRLLVPRHVNIVLTAVTGVGGGEGMPLLLGFKKAEEKNLAELSREMTDEIRALRRRAIAEEKGYQRIRRFALLPSGLRWIVYRFASKIPRLRRGMAEHLACVFITSVTQFSNGRGGWGLPIMPYSLGFTLGGISKRPWVVDDQVVVRECLDFTITVDHIITDGAAGCLLANELAEEIESGRLLAEFDLPRSD